METILINVGPLTSFNSLVYHLGSRLSQVRDAYVHGQTPQIVLDFRNVRLGVLGVPALAAFLSSSKKLKDFLGYPIPLLMKWDPELQGFLADIGFIESANHFKIFEWEPKGILGGYKTGRLNPLSGILYYSDKLSPTDNWSEDDYLREKDIRKRKIAPNFLLRCSKIFSAIENERSTNIIANTALEMIVNSLIHGEDHAFIGVQLRKNRITLSVCDSGIGFPKSLNKSFKLFPHFGKIDHATGIVIGSLIQKNQHGLRLAIEEVLNFSEDDIDGDNINEGWVTISSFDAEVRWQKSNWRNAIDYFDKLKIDQQLPDIIQILGKPTKEFIDRDKVDKGYWKKFESYIVGTRIAFEINL